MSGSGLQGTFLVVILLFIALAQIALALPPAPKCDNLFNGMMSPLAAVLPFGNLCGRLSPIITGRVSVDFYQGPKIPFHLTSILFSKAARRPVLCFIPEPDGKRQPVKGRAGKVVIFR